MYIPFLLLKTNDHVGFIVIYCKIKVYSLLCFHIVKLTLSFLVKYDWKLRNGAAIMSYK